MGPLLSVVCLGYHPHCYLWRGLHRTLAGWRGWYPRQTVCSEGGGRLAYSSDERIPQLWQCYSGIQAQVQRHRAQDILCSGVFGGGIKQECHSSKQTTPGGLQQLGPHCLQGHLGVLAGRRVCVNDQADRPNHIRQAAIGQAYTIAISHGRRHQPVRHVQILTLGSPPYPGQCEGLVHSTMVEPWLC